MDALEPITLVIKAPNQKIADQTIECSLEWTVKHLKKHLSNVYPSKPLENQQRIIYSGHLLQNDNSKLKDILKQYEPNQKVHTVHLVCSTPSVDALSSIAKQSEGLRNRRPGVARSTDSVPTTDSVTTETLSQGSLGASYSDTPQYVQAVTGTVDPTLYNYYYNLMQQGATGQPVFTPPASPDVNTPPQMGSFSSSFTPAPPAYSSLVPGSPYPSYFPVGMLNSTYGGATYDPSAFGAMPGAGRAYDPAMFGTVPGVGGVYNSAMFGTVPGGMATGSALAMQASHFLTSVQQQQQQIIQQQLYAGYYNSYMQYFQAAGSARQPIHFPPGTSVAGFHLPAELAAQNAAQDVQQPVAQGARPAEPQAVRMNAQGGPMLDDEDGEEANRDWLDWIYTFIRFSMLLCILYFYSTFSRFITALFFMVVFFLYQGGWFRMQRRVDPNQNRQPQQPQRQQQQRNENRNVAEGEDLNDGAAAADNNREASAEPAAAAAPERPGALSLAWNFFISFFLSLAPQAPPAVNAN